MTQILSAIEQLASLDADGYIRRVWSIDQIDAEIERITKIFPPHVRAEIERKGRLGYRYTPAIYRALVIARGILIHRAEWTRIQMMPAGPDRREAEEDHFQGGWSHQRYEFESAGDLVFSRSDLDRSGIMDPIRGELLVADVKRREVQNDRRSLLEAILDDQPLPDFS